MIGSRICRDQFGSFLFSFLLALSFTSFAADQDLPFIRCDDLGVLRRELLALYRFQLLETMAGDEVPMTAVGEFLAAAVTIGIQEIADLRPGCPFPS